MGTDPSDGGRGQDRWQAHPLAGMLLQFAIAVVPFVVGTGAGLLVSRAMPPSESVGDALLAFLVTGGAAAATALAVRLLVRRFVPLAWLLQLGLLFPGQAPSRFRVARSAGRVRDLEAAVTAAKQQGVGDEPLEAAERILTLVTALTSHDRRTRGHAERVRVFTDLVSGELGLSDADRHRLRWAALLHDVGKLHVPGRVLNKPGKPDDSEWRVLKDHPVAGDRLISPLKPWLGRFADVALEHHERFDGGGYPAGKRGGEISLGARVVSVADSYEVMTSARAYKRPMSHTAARQELVHCAGGQFDPVVVRAFLLIPVARLRWSTGPLAWLAQLPFLRRITNVGHELVTGPIAATGTAAAGTALMTAGVALAPGVLMPLSAYPDHATVGAAAASDATEVPGGTESRTVSGAAVPEQDGVSDDEGDAVPDGPADPAASDPSPTPKSSPEPSPTPEPSPQPSPTPEPSPQPSPTSSSEPSPTDPVTDVVEDTVDTTGEVLDETVDATGDVVDTTTDTVDETLADPVGTVESTAEDPIGTTTETTTELLEPLEEPLETATETDTESIEDVLESSTTSLI